VVRDKGVFLWAIFPAEYNETELAIVLTVPQCLHLSTGDFISENHCFSQEVSGFLDTVARFEHFGGRKVMNPASTSSSSGIRIRLVMGVVFTGACSLWFVILCYNSMLSFKPVALHDSDPIVDIWINKMLGYFLVFLPDKTVKLYESYSFELDSLGQWRRVEDRPIYPESPKVRLPSYTVEFENGRVMEVFLYPIAHHDSIVIEDQIIGHRGYNRLSDVDDPNRFYHHRFRQDLPQELSIVNNYWNAHNGRPNR
jgi:hypothetical protein